jgi:hypothetical protein
MSTVRAHGENEAPGWSHHTWEQCGPCLIFACSTLAFPLQLRKKAGKTSVRVVKKCQLGTIRYDDMATLWQVVTTSLSTPVSLRMLEKMCQHSVNTDICQGVPYQLTFSRISWLKLWCGQQRMQLPNPQEFAYYKCTRVKWKQCENNWIEACSFLAWARVVDLQMGHM